MLMNAGIATNSCKKQVVRLNEKYFGQTENPC